MPLLRIVLAGTRVGLRHAPAQGVPLTAEVPFEFRQTPQQRDDRRWYLEDFIRYPDDPAPAMAARIEGDLRRTGASLFAAVFGGSAEARAIWASARSDLGKTRVEIVSSDTDIPWELMREGEDDAPIALTAASFVRAAAEPAASPAVRHRAGPLRILLVICRPAGFDDVPFRSVAGRLIESLGRAGECRVLRPPTFERLHQELTEARDAGRPYDIVHFDGHGVYLDQAAQELDQRPDVRRMRGYLVFEAEGGGEQNVDGTLMGGALQAGETPILLLNACRSAHAKAAGPSGDDSAAGAHRPFGSLAQEVSACGAAGVVAMRYNVFVETAATFVAQTYAGLTAGETLGAAVGRARRRLAERSTGSAGGRPRIIEDWCVPEVYEARPWSIGAREAAASVGAPQRLDQELPPPPPTGFIGHDAALLGMDRALDSHAAVLLHGTAGAGKTAAAVEFARWYASTGGIESPVAFVALGGAFAETLAEARWPLSTLWVCDGCERLTSPADRRDFLAFLRSVRESKGKAVITGRSPEESWIPADAAHRLWLGPILQPDNPDLLRRLIETRGAAVETEALNGLIALGVGNPMTLAGLVGQAIENGVSTPEACQAFIDRLRRDGFDPVREPMLRQVADSLTASLTAFTEPDQARLSLLCLFDVFVNYDFFRLMGGWPGQPKPEWGLDILHGLSFADVKALFDRAADLGLLVIMGNTHYTIHPALFWAFRPLYRKFPAEQTERAFVKAHVDACANFNDQMGRGNNVVLRGFEVEHGNVRRALDLARQHGWWEDEIAISKGLLLFLQLGQRTQAFNRLAGELVRVVIDPQTDDVRPGRESHLSAVMENLAAMAENQGDLDSAETLLGYAIDHNRPRVSARQRHPDYDPAKALDIISELALEVYRRGQIRFSRSDAKCLGDFQEAIALYQHVGLRSLAANPALDAATACMRLQSLRDLDAAEQLFLRAHDWCDQRDTLLRAKCCIQLAGLAQERHGEAQSKEAALRALQQANAYTQRALAVLPEIAIRERAVCHSRLGTNLRTMGELDSALEHSQAAITLFDRCGDVLWGGQMRLSIANVAIQQGRYPQAAEYVREALRRFKGLGSGAAAQAANAEQRLAWIEANMAPRSR